MNINDIQLQKPMPRVGDNLGTPIYLNTEKNLAWPKDRLFYVIASNGTFICRNHDWFTSCVPATKGPGELEQQEQFTRVNYPKVPRALMEKAVGFFRRIEKDRHWESALILAWNRDTNEMELICPDQQASGASVNYDIPKDLPHNLALIGDIHSHCNFSPTPSMTDENDEMHRPGLHIVAGYIMRPEPEFYCVAVVDGERSQVEDLSEVMEAFDPRMSDMAAVPQEWLSKVKEKKYTWNSSWDSKPSKRDMPHIKRVLKSVETRGSKPEVRELSDMLYSVAFSASRKWCDDKAKEVVKQWCEDHGQPFVEEEVVKSPYHGGLYQEGFYE